MKTHTPGPWKWLIYPDGRKLLVAPSRAVIHCPDTATMTVDERDRALIASAPDLLAERDRLRAALEAAEWGGLYRNSRGQKIAVCAVCGQAKRIGHASDCILRAALRGTEGP